MKHSPVRQSSCWFHLLVAMVLLLAAGLRAYHLGTQPLSREEGAVVQTAAHSLADTIKMAREEAYPLGYEILLVGWQAVAGSSEVGLRLSSVLIGVLTVALVHRLGASFFNRPTGLLAAVAVAINPIQVYHGQDATSSALIGLLGIASLQLTHTVLNIPAGRQTGRFRVPQAAIRAAGYVLVNAAGLYTHFSFFMLLIVAETFIFLLWLSRRPHKLHGVIVWVVLQATTLLLSAPWLLAASSHLADRESLAFDLLLRLEDVAYGLTLPVGAAQNGLVPLLLLAAFGLFPPAESSGEPRTMRFVERVGLVATGVAIPLIALARGGNSHQRVPDFVVPANLALMLLASRGVMLGYQIGKPLPSLGRGGSSAMHLAVCLMAVLGLLPVFSGLQHLYSDPAYARDDYRSIATRIRVEAGSQAAIVLQTPEQLGVFTYYYPEGENILALPNEDTEGILARLITSQRRIYAVFWNAEAQDPDQLVEETLNANAIVASTDQYGGTRLAIYAVTGRPAIEPQTVSRAQFGTSIILEGFALSAATLAPGEGLGVTLFWHTGTPLKTRYKIFVHLYGPDGTLVAQHDSEPANFAAPTDSWLPDQPVIDHHGLLMPDASPGTYTLMVGMYDTAAGRLPISIDGEPVGDHLVLSEITVP